MAELRPEVQAYYEAGREIGRLSDGSLAGPLEFARTRERDGPSVPGHFGLRRNGPFCR